MPHYVLQETSDIFVGMVSQFCEILLNKPLIATIFGFQALRYVHVPFFKHAFRSLCLASQQLLKTNFVVLAKPILQGH